MVFAPVMFFATWAALGGRLRLDMATLENIFAAGVVALGTYSGNTFLSPDLDTPSTPYNKWKQFRWLWLPYQILVPHRSKVSHWPILGAVLAEVYIIFMTVLVIFLVVALWNCLMIPFTDVGQVYGAPPIPWQFLTNVCRTVWDIVMSPIYALFLLGHVNGAMHHCIMDFADSKRRRHSYDQPTEPLSEDERNAHRRR